MIAQELPEEVLRQNLQSPFTVPRGELKAVFDRLQGFPVASRVSAWAEFFLKRGGAMYVFGDAPSGYASLGLLVDDMHFDCVLFVCRVVELATSNSAEEAIARACALRFPGAAIEEIALSDGTVDYRHPKRLAYGWDMARSGGYGKLVTETVGEVVTDPGTPRYKTEAVSYVPFGAVKTDALKDGDVIYFVLDEAHKWAAELREKTGAVVGHMGIASVSAGGTNLIHAASHDLPGVYEGRRVVGVPLRTYLDRVERFKGILVTRLA